MDDEQTTTEEGTDETQQAEDKDTLDILNDILAEPMADTPESLEASRKTGDEHENEIDKTPDAPNETHRRSDPGNEDEGQETDEEDEKEGDDAEGDDKDSQEAGAASEKELTLDDMESADDKETDPRDAEIAALRAQLAENSKAVEELKSSGEKSAGEKTAAETAEAAAKIPSYDDVTIPSTLVDKFMSGERADIEAALKGMSIGLARMIHSSAKKDIFELVNDTIKGTSPETPTEEATEAAAASTAKTVFTDFYGSYPKFNTPELRPVVVAAATALANEKKLTGEWNPGVRKLVAERALAMHNATRKAGRTSKKRRRGDGQRTGSTRPGDPSKRLSDQQRHLQDVLTADG